MLNNLRVNEKEDPPISSAFIIQKIFIRERPKLTSKFGSDTITEQFIILKMKNTSIYQHIFLNGNFGYSRYSKYLYLQYRLNLQNLLFQPVEAAFLAVSATYLSLIHI